jgi:putative two-component system response regulator
LIKKKTIALIDDEGINHIILIGLLSNFYNVVTFDSSIQFFNFYKDTLPDLILLDIVMPDIDGFSTIIEIRKLYPTSSIPIIFLTSKNDNFDEAKGFQLGAVDYITKPFIPVILIERIKSHLKLVEIQNELKTRNESLNRQVEERIREYNAIQDLSLTIIADIVEIKDADTGNHITRTQHFFKIIAEELKNNSIYRNELKEVDINQLAKSSILHDIGKVAIPEHILKKPGKLDSDEWEIMKKHCEYGSKVIQKALKHIHDGEELLVYEMNNLIKFYENASEIALFHHEKWNGFGYPLNLSGTKIPLSARIMAVADVFDALSTKRVYKDAWDLDKILEHIQSEKNNHFDPIIIEAFFNRLEEMKYIMFKYSD